MANRYSFKVKVWLLLVAIIAALIFIGTLVFTTDEVTADQLSSVSAISYLPIVPGLIAMLVFVRPRTIKRFCHKVSYLAPFFSLPFCLFLIRITIHIIHGRISGSMFIVITPFFGCILTKQKRDVILDRKALTG